MAGFFYQLGKMVGPKLRQANWVFRSLTGTETEAARAEYAVGQDLARVLAGQLEIDPDPGVRHLLQEVVARLAACLRNRQQRFTVHAVRASPVNAFALPGGFLFITGALLDCCGRNPDETAFVLAHEMAHVVLHHASARLLANSSLRVALARLGPARGLLGPPLASLASTLLEQGYARDQELEADRLAVRLARAAGFDARAGTRLLARLPALTDDHSGLHRYFCSHPPPGVRIQEMRRTLE